MPSPTLSTLSANLTSLFAPESWNQKRSSDELRSFVARRLENCTDDAEFDVEL
jgi:hypothetical protein